MWNTLKIWWRRRRSTAGEKAMTYRIVFLFFYFQRGVCWCGGCFHGPLSRDPHSCSFWGLCPLLVASGSCGLLWEIDEPALAAITKFKSKPLSVERHSVWLIRTIKLWRSQHYEGKKWQIVSDALSSAASCFLSWAASVSNLAERSSDGFKRKAISCSVVYTELSATF